MGTKRITGLCLWVGAMKGWHHLGTDGRARGFQKDKHFNYFSACQLVHSIAFIIVRGVLL